MATTVRTPLGVTRAPPEEALPVQATRPAPSAPAIDGMRALFDREYPRVWRLLRRFGVPAHQLDDAAQEVFWVAARRLTEIEPGREQAFLYGVALRVAVHEGRRQRRLPDAIDIDELARIADPGPSPEEELEARRTREVLDLVLARLPIELRTVLVLVELEELEVREVAAIEGIPLGTASSRLRRAREEFSAIAKRVRTALQRQTRGGQ